MLGLSLVFVTMVTAHSYNSFSTQNNLSSNTEKKTLALDDIKKFSLLVDPHNQKAT